MSGSQKNLHLLDEGFVYTQMLFAIGATLGELIIAVANTIQIACVTYPGNIGWLEPGCDKIGRLGNSAMAENNVLCNFLGVHFSTCFQKNRTQFQYACV
jgi:hypothetical protein